ncbi:hypothetical protein [Clostridium saccharoperbutylacetonicum]|uniref:hypothetical protein n=1 Tax=Clostridium saccharoperbutylacetonicum TaxID=36745 RepID=UPI0039ECF9B4
MSKMTKKKRIVKELKKELFNKELDIRYVDDYICSEIEGEGEEVNGIFYNDSAFYIKEERSYAYQFKDNYEDMDAINIEFEIVKDEWDGIGLPDREDVIVKITNIEYL